MCSNWNKQIRIYKWISYVVSSFQEHILRLNLIWITDLCILSVPAKELYMTVSCLLIIIRIGNNFSEFHLCMQEFVECMLLHSSYCISFIFSISYSWTRTFLTHKTLLKRKWNNSKYPEKNCKIYSRSCEECDMLVCFLNVWEYFVRF